MDTIDIDTEKSRRVEQLARRLDRHHAGLPPIPAPAKGLTKASRHGADTRATGVSKKTAGQA